MPRTEYPHSEAWNEEELGKTFESNAERRKRNRSIADSDVKKMDQRTKSDRHTQHQEPRKKIYDPGGSRRNRRKPPGRILV
jgi:hypothetical protein